MRGKNPDYIDASCREQARAAASKFEAERESYRAESEADAAAEERATERNIARILYCETDREVEAFKTGMTIGRRDERNRLLTALTRLEQETAALWQEGSAVTRAVAAYTKAVRGIVEGKA